MNLFCENVTVAHCLVVVCNYVSPLFLYLKECIVISKFGSSVVQLRKRDKAYKA